MVDFQTCPSRFLQHVASLSSSLPFCGTYLAFSIYSDTLLGPAVCVSKVLRMSKTSIAPARTTISRSPSILLSPSKRRKLDHDEPLRTTKSNNAAFAREDEDQRHPTPADILRWTFTRAAIASCFVRDVFQMKESGTRGE